MNKSPLRVFVYKSEKLYNLNKYNRNNFYQEVQDMLRRWKDNVPTRDPERSIYRMLYEPFEVSAYPREKRLTDNLNALHSALVCRDKYRCHNLALCPDCLARWRYHVASVLQAARETNPKIRLIQRQESILMPRGVYRSADDGLLHAMAGCYINPVYELPVGTKWSPYWIWRIVENDDYYKYKNDPDLISNQYSDCIQLVWNAISGSDVVENVAQLDRHPNRSDEQKAKYVEGRKKMFETRKTNIKKGIDDPDTNTLITGLFARASRLNKIQHYNMGAIHRVIVIPSLLNDSTILLRLDSIMLDTRDGYKDVYSRYDEWTEQKHFDSIPWPNRPTYVWHPRWKMTQSCRPIPQRMIDILKIVESCFPCTCNLYHRLIPEEFPFYLNNFTCFPFIRTSGFFRGSN